MTTINSQEDFLRALRENPEWREAVRALILGEEMLNLPAALQRLSDTVDRFIANQDRFNEELRSFQSDQRTFNEDMRQFSSNTLKRFDRMEGDNSQLKYYFAQRRTADTAEFIAVDLGLEYVRNMTSGEMAQLALAAAGGQALSSELKSFRGADVVSIVSDHGETKYLAVEVSYTADQRDTERAIRNARILTEQTGRKTIPVIASTRNTREVQDQVDSGQVYWHQLLDRELFVLDE